MQFLECVPPGLEPWVGGEELVETGPVGVVEAVGTA